MNTATHFLTGYLIGRLAVKKENGNINYFIPFFVAMVALLPDLDAFLHLIIPIEAFEHAIFTHTIIGALFLTVIYTIITWGIGHNYLKELDIDFKFLLLIALAGIASHLILDIFTYREDIWTTSAHLYFWPLSNFSFHLNAFFHQSVYPNIYTIRIIIEVIYTAFLVVIIIFYGWFYKKENPFLMFFPENWSKFASESARIEETKRIAYFLLIFNFGLITLMVISLFA